MDTPNDGTNPTTSGTCWITGDTDVPVTDCRTLWGGTRQVRADLVTDDQPGQPVRQDTDDDTDGM